MDASAKSRCANVFRAPMGARRDEEPSMQETPLGARAISYGKWSRRRGVGSGAAC